MDLIDFRTALVASIPMAERAGIEIVDAERGRAVCRIPLEGNGNHIGTMYAGGLFTVSEFAGGVLVAHSMDITALAPIIAGLDIRFLKPARSDVTVTLTMSDEDLDRVIAEATERGRSAFTLDAELIDADGTVVATTHGDYQVRSLDRLRST